MGSEASLISVDASIFLAIFWVSCLVFLVESSFATRCGNRFDMATRNGKLGSSARWWSLPHSTGQVHKDSPNLKMRTFNWSNGWGSISRYVIPVGNIPWKTCLYTHCYVHKCIYILYSVCDIVLCLCIFNYIGRERSDAIFWEITTHAFKTIQVVDGWNPAPCKMFKHREIMGVTSTLNCLVCSSFMDKMTRKS